MSYKYFTVLTDVGKQKLAEAIANETALDFTEMAVGDSNGTSYEPTSDMTALKHVTYRAAIGSMKINAEDKNIMEFEFVVPASTGGFYVREAGLYSSDGTLIAISRLPEQYKADMAEGAGSSMTVRILVAISSDAQIYITVPASITYATQTYVAEEFKKHKADSNPHEQYVLNKTYSAKIDELEEDINSKAANTHNHDSTYLKKTDASSTYATKSELSDGLAGKAATNHSHSNYAANNHNHDSVYSKTNHTHTGYAASNHSHTFSAITGSMAITDSRLTGNLPVARVTGALGKPSIAHRLEPQQSNGTNYKSGDVIYRYSIGPQAINQYVPAGGTWLVQSIVFSRDGKQAFVELGGTYLCPGGTQLDTNRDVNFIHMLTKIS